MNKQSKITFYGLIKVIAVFTAVLSVVSYLTFFSTQDEHFWFLALTNHFKFQYFLISVVLSSLFFLLREFRYSAVMVLVACLNSVYILPWYFEFNASGSYDVSSSASSASSVSSVSSSKPIATIKLVHSNVQSQNSNYQPLQALIKKESPDIFVAQEINKRWLSELKSIEDFLPYTIIRTREDNFGIALFSKYPLDSAEFIYYGGATVPSIKVSLTVAERQITLITTHPLPPINRAYFDSRNSQLTAISLANKTVQTPLILIGDFNVTMWSKYYDVLEADGKLVNTSKGVGLQPSWPTSLLPMMIPIDHCLISKEFDVLEMSVGPDVGSDHLPLIVTLGLRE